MPFVGIAGIGGGIGQAIAKKLWTEGWSIGGFDVDEEGLFQLERFFKSTDLKKEKTGRQKNYFLKNCDGTQESQLDLFLKEWEEMVCGKENVQEKRSEEGSLEKIYQKNQNTFKIQAMIYSAGKFLSASIEELRGEQIHELWNVNVFGAMMFTKKVLPWMDPKTGGKLLYLSSISATQGAPCASLYAATKGALSAFAKSLTRELGSKNIQVLALEPGLVDTQMAKPFLAQAMFSVRMRAPVKRLAQPQEIAEVVDHLLKIQSPFLWGGSLKLDGGFHLG